VPINSKTSISDDYFKTIADGMYSAIICFDMDKKIAYYNPSLDRITGYKVYNGGEDFWSFVLPQYRIEVLHRWSQGFENRAFDNYEFQITTKDGAEKWLDLHCHPIYDRQQQQVAVYIRLVDIDTHKRAGIAYSRNPETIMTGFLKAPFPTAIIASDGEIVQINHSWVSYTGYTLAELNQPATLVKLFQLETVAQLQSHIKSWFDSKHEELKGEIKIVTKTGKLRVWEFGTTPLNIVLEDRSLVLGMVYDITEERLALQAIQESESRFRLVADSAPVMIWQTDKIKGATFFNQTWIDFIGRPIEEMLHYGWIDFIHPDDRDKVVETYINNTSEISKQVIEFRLMKHDGQYHWIYNRGTPRFTKKNEFVGYIGSSLDITERKSAEEKIKESEANLQAIFNSSIQSFILLDRDYRVQVFNNKANQYAQTLFTRDIQKGTKIFEYIFPKDKDALIEKFELALSGTFVKVDYEMKISENHSIWLEMTYLPVYKDELIIGVCLSTLDITDRRLLDNKLTRDAFYDTLTDLPNRRYFLDELNKCFDQKIANPDYFFAVFFMDLDRFKSINDSLGHTIGDQLLIAVSKRLRYIIKPIDIVARLGGDEFIILIKNVNTIREVVKIAENIQKQISQPFSLDTLNLTITSSIGIAPANKNYVEAEDILRDADTAMYRAKSKGKNTYTIFSQEMHTLAIKTLKTEVELIKALKKNQLELYYQPVWDISKNIITSCEALIRWNHPTRGTLTPKDFMSIAEETNLVVEIDKWVFDSACKQLSIWEKLGLKNFKIAVNISLKQLKQERLLFWVKKTLLKYSIEPHQLKFELTENSLIDDSQQTIDTLNQLRNLGIQLCIDDFGTGYSSLVYLKNLPVDILKIDRAFVMDVAKSAQSQAITKSIVDLAHSLNLRVTAEGVENKDQLDFLESISCDQIQGYYISRPVCAQDFIKLLDF